ncbi:MAG: hypothetical protein GY814_11015 [Gammaproteobacteria bacterium]|nr:hypothetical protein [Gammaproteobacteria bacterium]
MKISTSKEREAQKQPTPPEPYQHPKAIKGHVYMMTQKGEGFGDKYFAVHDYPDGNILLYSIDYGWIWDDSSTFGSNTEWKDITSKVYLNTDELGR